MLMTIRQKAVRPTATVRLATVKAMRILKLKEYERYPCEVPLSQEQRQALSKSHIARLCISEQGRYLRTHPVILCWRREHWRLVRHCSAQDPDRPGHVHDDLRDGP